jgi:hypothetical protein
MKKYLFVLLVGLAAACSPSRHGSAAGASSSLNPGTGVQDGNSFVTAVVIQETHETPGVHAEYKWIADHYPGYKTKMQALTNNKGKPYDVLTIELSDGSEKKVYFDISNFFGKF